MCIAAGRMAMRDGSLLRCGRGANKRGARVSMQGELHARIQAHWPIAPRPRIRSLEFCTPHGARAAAAAAVEVHPPWICTRAPCAPHGPGSVTRGHAMRRVIAHAPRGAGSLRARKSNGSRPSPHSPPLRRAPGQDFAIAISCHFCGSVFGTQEKRQREGCQEGRVQAKSVYFK